MIIVLAEATTRPDRIAALSDQLASACAASRQDSGCISYDFYGDLTDPTKVVAVERWESREHLQAHLDTHHVRELSVALGKALTGPPVTHVYDVVSGDDLG